jgi:hypothetical protein
MMGALQSVWRKAGVGKEGAIFVWFTTCEVSMLGPFRFLVSILTQPSWLGGLTGVGLGAWEGLQ